MRMEGAAVLVTGGGRGLGAALGKELAGRGARVVLAARSRPELDGVAAAIRAAGGEAHAVGADLGDPDAVHALAGTAAALVGPIDVLVHNASGLGPVPLRSLAATDARDLQALLDVNLLGPFRLTQALVGGMVLRGRGLVLGISSDAAVTAYAGWGGYGVTKAALDHLLRAWAVELADAGVRFLSVDPGEMDTAMHAAAVPEADRAQLARPEDVAFLLAQLMARAESVPSGSRLEAGQLRRVA
jgi:NAD(P)-dependent dehydrogenase (short-subunit alcohol dehydrogenase family)